LGPPEMHLDDMPTGYVLFPVDFFLPVFF